MSYLTNCSPHNPSVFLFPLTTQVLDENQNSFSVGMNKNNHLCLKDGKIIGFMSLRIKEDHVFIEKMQSYDKSFKHVGSALHEFAIRESFNKGLEGRVRLEAACQSDGFHFINGFRYEEPFRTTMSFYDDFNKICDLTREYLHTPSEELKIKIKSNPFYKKLKGRDVKQLGRKPSNFQEKILHRCFVDLNQRLQQAYFNADGTRKKNEEKMDYGGLMFLSDEIRLLWKCRLGL